MEQALVFAFVLTIAFCVSFYAGRECLQGVIFLICRSAGRSTAPRFNLGACDRKTASPSRSCPFLDHNAVEAVKCKPYRHDRL